MKIHLLDMGRAKYGDCILITEGEHTLLVDGGHPGDGTSIKRQLEELLGKPAPHKLDLLIVTHCHSDHIGCLPDLVKTGDIQPDVALVSDETLGWGRLDDMASDNATLLTLFSEPEKTLALALQEEDRSDIRDEDMQQFFYDVLRLEDNYKAMLNNLRRNGTTVVRYGSHTEVEMDMVLQAGEAFRLKILGPTKNHLQICADAIPGSTDSGIDSFTPKDKDNVVFADLAEAYRNAAQKMQRDAVSGLAADRAGVGAAKNNQSIVFSVEAPESEKSWRALLAADMQFAKSEVSRLDDEMESLLEVVDRAGPYDFIKLTHHSSYNGLNDALLEKWNQHTKLFAHTGGRNDVSHPDGGVLRILEERFNDGQQLGFARTDHNGIVTASYSPDGVQMDISRGDFNDFTPNIAADQQPAIAPPIPVTPTVAAVPALPAMEEPVTAALDFVEIHAKVPHLQTKVTLTIEVEPGKKKADDVAAGRIKRDIKSNSRLAGLLFVTSWTGLENNLSSPVVEQLKQKLDSEKLMVIDVPSSALSTAESVAAYTRGELQQEEYKGVVILGGYDVLPAQKLDVLSPELREELKIRKRIQSDDDDFIIWSDDLYGDINRDGFPELPVSRIPDGRDPGLLLKALSTAGCTVDSRFGIRNLARPFATDVYDFIPGTVNQCEVSEKFGLQNIESNTAKGAVYYMLHGSDIDGTLFWGETKDGSEYKAFSVQTVPTDATGTVVFTGCCWGGLIAEPTANNKSTAAPIRPRTPDQSIALKYVQAGANAFVGCTGSHYSPRKPPYNYYGKPLHDHFWRSIKAGKGPAQALFEAKCRYKKELPYSTDTAFSQAIEYKILRQFTVIGLGW